MLRALDIPARIVTGYQGIDPLPIDGFYTVRQSAAHAWAEYWIAGKGWVRSDPTAAVAPDRIRINLTLRPAPGLVADAWGKVSPAFLTDLRDLWDAANNRWNQWVLSYTKGHQINLMKALGLVSPSWQDLALVLIVALSTIALVVAGWAWWDRARIDPWLRQRDILRRRLRMLGIESLPHEPPRMLAQRVRQRLGDQGFALAELLERLDLQHYGPAARSRPDPRLTRRFQAEARAILRAGNG